MGLLDGLLGQVLGGMTPGGAPGGGNPMGRAGGGLGDLLNQLGGGMGAQQDPRSGGLSGAALPALLMLGLTLLQKHGGIEGVLGRLRETGHGQEADSWVSTGGNLPIDASALSNVFGDDEIARMAQQTGLTPQQASGGLAALFPEIINQMTPGGQVETESDDAVQRALESLRRQQATR